MSSAPVEQEFYEVKDLARLARLSAYQVRKMLEQYKFERPGGPKTKWRVSHVELMAKWPELVLSVKEVRAARLRAELEQDANAA